MIRVNIGCGQTPTPGWRNFDNSLSIRFARFPAVSKFLYRMGILGETQYRFVSFARTHCIEYADAAARLPLVTGSVDVVYTSHMLEHLDRPEADAFLREAFRVLRPGGILRVVVPDLQLMARRYSESGDADSFVAATDMWMPAPRTLVQRFKLALIGTRHHLWMYDGRSLSALLSRHGFCNSAVLPPGETRIATPGDLDICEQSAGSVYVEAEKPPVP